MKHFYVLLMLLGFQILAAQQKKDDLKTPLEAEKITAIEEKPKDVSNEISSALNNNETSLGLELPVLEDPDFYGASKGKFEVSLTGAATYNFPIEVPPGINGIIPQIGLSYSSQGMNGLAGYGWSISGLSAISKIGSNKFYDGKNSTITYSADDRFIFDGQRLLLKSGIYGWRGAEYETEGFSNLKITGIGNGDNYGHEYFKVEYPDGTIAYYGRTYESAIAGLPGSKTKTNITYALTYVTNPQNIVIRYSYINDNGNLLISSIWYGFRSSNPLSGVMLNSSYNAITFTYKNRNRYESNYVANEAIKLTKILDKVTVKGFSENYRTYQLTYKTGSLGYEQLQSITETSGDGTLSKKPVSFVYGADPTQNLVKEQPEFPVASDEGSLSSLTAKNTQAIPGDFSGSGKLGYLLYHTSYNDDQQYTQGNVFRIFDPGTGTLKSRTFTVPFNEVVTTKTLSTNGVLLPNQGITTITKTNTVPFGGHHTYNFNHFIYIPETIYPIVPTTVQNFNLRDFGVTRDYFISGDFNGDGISDIIRTEHPKNYIDNTYSQYSTKLEIIDLKNNAIYSDQTLPIGFNYQVVDVDGDGYDEFVVVRHGQILIHRFNQTSKKLELSQTISSSNISYTSTDKRPVYLGDFNGDGKIDFITPKAYNSAEWFFYINKGTQFAEIPKNIGITFSPSTEEKAFNVLGQFLNYWNVNEYGYIFTDINNDGKTDIIKTHDYSQVRNNTNIDTGIETKLWIYENMNFDIENQNISFLSYNQSLATANKRSPIYTVSNFNQKDYKTELAIITNNRLRTIKFDRNNIITQQLKTVSEYDMTTKIVYDSYDEKKTKIDSDPTKSDGEDAVLPFISFNDPDAVYPKADINVAPGLYLVKKVTYDSNKGFSIGGNTTERKQLFSYADATISHNGKGFLGFKGRMSTNIYRGGPSINDLKDQLKSILVFDLDNNNLIKEEITAHSTDWTGFLLPPVNYITKKTYEYAVSNLVNKVFKADNTKITIDDKLSGIQRIITNSYDAYSNPLTVREIITGNSDASVLKTSFIYANNPSTDNYYIGRLLSKTMEMNNEETTKEQFSFTGNLLTNITKRGILNSSELSETNEYDAFGNIIKKTISSSDVQPRIVSYVYDLTGRFIEKTIDMEGLETTFSYNKNKGWLLSTTNPYGVTTSTGYNAFGMAISQTDYLGKVTTMGYKTSSAILSGTIFVRKETSYPDGRKEYITTNGWGNKTIERMTDIDGNWISSSYSYDSQDRLIQKSEPYKNSATLFSTFEYDQYGRIIKTILPTGKEITVEYNGLTTTVNDGVKVKSETKNVSNQTVKVVDNGETINYTYNGNGTLKNTDYGGNVISFEYDGWGRKTKMTDPSAGSYTYEYNSIGDLLKETTPNGVTTHIYDATGKISQTTQPGNIINYVYRTDKLLDKITTSSTMGTYQEIFTYDSYKRVTSKKYSTPLGFNYTYTYTFDDLGRKLTEEKQVVGPSGTDAFKTKNVYKNGYLWKVQNAYIDSDLKVYNGFNERGLVTNFSLGNGLSTINTYDQYGYLTQISVAQQFVLTNTWDIQRGNLNSRTSSLFSGGISETFQYDSFDRLISNSAVHGSSIIGYESNNYDSKGRITSNAVGNYTYDSTKPYQLQKIENLNDLAYYQNNPLQQVEYDAQKLPRSIKQQGKENIYFNYDGFKNRTAMYYGNEATTYTSSTKVRYYSPVGDIEIDYDKTANKYVVNMYVDGDPYSANMLIRKENNVNGMYYLHRDYLGSILAITNSTGSIIEKRHFDAWGNVLLVQNGQNVNLNKLTFLDRGYTGHEHLQGVGLINMNARLYDPKLHRFLAPDNFVQDPTNSQNYNPYGYVWNNPLRHTDESGEFIVPILIGIGVGILTNGISNSIHHIPFFQGALKAGIIGGISGAVSFGIGGYINSLGAAGFQTAFASATAHAFAGGIMSYYTSGNFVGGFVAGGISSAFSKALGLFEVQNTYLSKGIMIAGSTAAAGTSSVIMGGSFWDGARQGFITAALNDAMHEGESAILKTRLAIQLKRAGYVLEQGATVSAEYIKEMISKVPLLKTIANKIGDLDVECWRLGGADVSPDGSQGYAKVAYDFVGMKVNFVAFFDMAFSTNFDLASTLGHELTHLKDIYDGKYVKWAEEGAANIKNERLRTTRKAMYTTWKAELRGYEWEMKNGEYGPAKSQYDKYYKLLNPKK